MVAAHRGLSVEAGARGNHRMNSEKHDLFPQKSPQHLFFSRAASSRKKNRCCGDSNSRGPEQRVLNARDGHNPLTRVNVRVDERIFSPQAN